MLKRLFASPTDRTQGRLLALAALFLAVYSLTLTLSPAARARSWSVPYRWDHWVALAIWLVAFALAHQQSARWLPERDPYLLPAAALLSGWGLLTIWRLFPAFGLRQAIWLVVAMAVFIAGLQVEGLLGFLRRYKYIWLTSGLVLTALTLLFGTNPSGGSPRLWLGCCGIYLQPSEPLKLLLIVYLAAYLAGSTSSRTGLALPLPVSSAGLLPLLAPTLIMTGLALLLLAAQRDLGTAVIFLFLYAVIVYVASGRKRILLFGGAALALAGTAGYLLFDVVRIRVDAWLNPWLDPSGRSFQIVQSLLAVANGGILGRGPGLGSPGLVPVPHSDFVFAAIAEENGLLGSLALLILVGLLAVRGLRAALLASDNYRRFLAAGLTAHLAAQSILIIGGNLRLLPLTGVTLPFVSYGGSSLLTSIVALLLLLQISSPTDDPPALLAEPQPYLQLGAFLLAGLGAIALVLGWWAVFRSPELLARTDNPRRAIADRFVQRGSILDRDNDPVSASFGQPGDYTRRVLYPPLSSVLGYTQPVYGQAGLEASLDALLRGQEGYPALTLWWNHLLYGQTPPGLDVRLSLDMDLQRLADAQLGEHRGALVLLDAKTGAVLAMASHPTFDANTLDQTWESLIKDPSTPLLNRAALGLYPPGPALGPLLLAAANGAGDLPALPASLDYTAQGQALHCAQRPAETSWPAAVSGGCPAAAAALGQAIGGDELLRLMDGLGLFAAPRLRLPSGSSDRPGALPDPAAAAIGEGLAVSPVQMALAAAALSDGGLLPVPHLVTAVNLPEGGWSLLPPLGEPSQALPAGAAISTARSLAAGDLPFWQALATARSTGSESGSQTVSWYLGGSLPGAGKQTLAIAVLLEEDNPTLAQQMGKAILSAALQP